MSSRLPALVLAAVLSCGLAVSHPRAARQPSPQQAPPLATTPNALRVAVLGDFGTGSKRQYELAGQMVKTHAAFPFELVLLVGDNLYGSERPQDFQKKFEIPYKPLLDAGVRFYASLGNHDAREQRYYKPFNMGGKLYYSFKAPKQSVRFFAFESTYPDPPQIAWLEQELKDAKEDWKVVFFHHPLYSSGERHGSDTRLRDVLEPLFMKYGVHLVFTGHDHFYERVKPQKGILYFVTGSGGQLRTGNIDRSSGLTDAGNDRDNVFLIGEFTTDRFDYRAIARSGTVVDSGSWPLTTARIGPD